MIYVHYYVFISFIPINLWVLSIYNLANYFTIVILKRIKIITLFYIEFLTIQFSHIHYIYFLELC